MLGNSNSDFVSVLGHALKSLKIVTLIGRPSVTGSCLQSPVKLKCRLLIQSYSACALASTYVIPLDGSHVKLSWVGNKFSFVLTTTQKQIVHSESEKERKKKKPVG